VSVVVEDPLIAAMDIERALPIHESSRRLRELAPESPRVHGVAVMADVCRRRWWPLDSALTTNRLEAMFVAGSAELEPFRVAEQLAATFTHAVLGRVVTLFMLEGRAWDAGPENLWMHIDSEGVIDWTGIVDPVLRVLPGDPASDGVVRLPNELALATWTAHRCHRSLAPLFAALAKLSNGALSVAEMWRMAGSGVVVTATQLPLTTELDELTSMRRGQAVLDAFFGFGLPVRAARRLRNVGLAV
jgi:hypothetical protein